MMAGQSALHSLCRPLGIVAVKAFSGLMSSADALAKAEASDPLAEPGMGAHREDVEAHRPRFRPLASDAMPDRL
jgi:hypothetical protein